MHEAGEGLRLVQMGVSLQLRMIRLHSAVQVDGNMTILICRHLQAGLRNGQSECQGSMQDNSLLGFKASRETIRRLQPMRLARDAPYVKGLHIRPFQSVRPSVAVVDCCFCVRCTAAGGRKMQRWMN